MHIMLRDGSSEVDWSRVVALHGPGCFMGIAWEEVAGTEGLLPRGISDELLDSQN